MAASLKLTAASKCVSSGYMGYKNRPDTWVTVVHVLVPWGASSHPVGKVGGACECAWQEMPREEAGPGRASVARRALIAPCSRAGSRSCWCCLSLTPASSPRSRRPRGGREAILLRHPEGLLWVESGRSSWSSHGRRRTFAAGLRRLKVRHVRVEAGRPWVARLPNLRSRATSGPADPSRSARPAARLGDTSIRAISLGGLAAAALRDPRLADEPLAALLNFGGVLLARDGLADSSSASTRRTPRAVGAARMTIVGGVRAVEELDGDAPDGLLRTVLADAHRSLRPLQPPRAAPGLRRPASRR
jgi:hypothetical protein